MFRTVFVFLFWLMLFQTVKAQKPDTILLYMTNHDEVVTNIDSADYYLRIIPGSQEKGTANKITEFYTNRQPKLDGTANVNFISKTIRMTFFGPREDFFPNGHLKSITSYQNGYAIDEKLYYPNGELYVIEDLKKKPLFIEYHDTTGKILAENGNGKWVRYNDDFTKIIEQGSIKDSLKEGEWHEMINNTEYVKFYKKGDIISVAKGNEEPIYYDADKQARYPKGDIPGFMNFLSHTIQYPFDDKRNGIEGKVIVTFVVEKDGSLTNVTALRGTDKSMMDAAVEGIQQSPHWLPAMKGGKAAREQFTIGFNFSLINKYHE